jgi:hypothetical protein
VIPKKRRLLFLFMFSVRSERSMMMNEQVQPSPRRGTPSGHSLWQKKHAGKAMDSAGVGLSSNPPLFDQFLEAVRRQMQPEGRAQHTAGMHQYLRTLLPEDVTLADLAAGWQVLAKERNETNSAVRSRRQTCAELAAIAAQVTSEPGELAKAVKAWQAWQDASLRSADARLMAMRATFARELGELQSASDL